MSALDDIGAAAKALNDLTAQEAAEKARIDAAVAAALGALIAPYKTIYVDAVAGLDTFDGSSPAKAVATLQAAAALVGAGQRGIAVLCSDVTLAAPLQVVGDLIVYSYGNGETGTASTVRTLKILPSALAQSSFGPTCAIGSAIGSWLYIMGVNVQIGALTQGQSVFGLNGSFLLGRAALSWDPALAIPVFATSTSLRALLYASSLPASYPGKLFSGVPAGANPNSATIQTNITSA